MQTKQSTAYIGQKNIFSILTENILVQQAMMLQVRTSELPMSMYLQAVEEARFSLVEQLMKYEESSFEEIKRGIMMTAGVHVWDEVAIAKGDTNATIPVLGRPYLVLDNAQTFEINEVKDLRYAFDETNATEVGLIKKMFRSLTKEEKAKAALNLFNNNKEKAKELYALYTGIRGEDKTIIDDTVILTALENMDMFVYFDEHSRSVNWVEPTEESTPVLNVYYRKRTDIEQAAYYREYFLEDKDIRLSDVLKNHSEEMKTSFMSEINQMTHELYLKEEELIDSLNIYSTGVKLNIIETSEFVPVSHRKKIEKDLHEYLQEGEYVFFSNEDFGNFVPYFVKTEPKNIDINDRTAVLNEMASMFEPVR